MRLQATTFKINTRMSNMGAWRSRVKIRGRAPLFWSRAAAWTIHHTPHTVPVWFSTVRHYNMLTLNECICNAPPPEQYSR